MRGMNVLDGSGHRPDETDPEDFTRNRQISMQTCGVLFTNHYRIEHEAMRLLGATNEIKVSGGMEVQR